MATRLCLLPPPFDTLITLNFRKFVMTSPQQEEQAYQAEIAEVEAWWKSPRFANVKRPYTAKDVASKRGTLKQSYPSDQMAKKFWNLVTEHQKAGTTSHTFGALDTIQVTQMGKYLETIYVSGWQSSSTASTSNEPGPDLAEYVSQCC